MKHPPGGLHNGVTMVERRPALGKGLSALIPEAPEPRTSPAEVDLDLLEPNAQQPRLQIDDARLDDLARSIRAHGIIQPIVVRKVGTRYEIIAGERRWRAAQRAGLLKVPVVVREGGDGDKKMLEMALIENIQREDLNPIEEAIAYQRLVDEFGLKQDDIAAAVGKDRSSVANYLRLLKLPDEVRHELSSGALTMGHARALLGLDDHQVQRHTAREVIARGLSVRDTETLVRKLLAPKPDAPAATAAAPATKDVHTRHAEEQLKLALGTRVRIVRKGHSGVVEIDFANEEELDRIYEYITGRA